MNLLGVFAKYWGTNAKTRLAAVIGSEAAGRIAREMLRVTLRRFQQCGDRRILAFWPSQSMTDFADLAGSDWDFECQTEGDLGSRMLAFFEHGFAAGARRIVLIGADSPTLPVEYLAAAFDALAHVSVVLGPADDGGYYLIGATGRTPAAFEDISWSDRAVYAQTIQRLGRAGVDFRTLPLWADVDRPADLDNLHIWLGDQQPLPAVFHELRKLVEQVRG